MIQNSPLVASIESIAHIVVGLSPSRVRDSEVRSEAVYTAINMLSLYHERIRANYGDGIARRVRGDSRQNHAGVIKARGTSLAIILRATQTVEVLLEMAAISFTGGSRRKWLLVMAVEVFKFVLLCVSTETSQFDGLPLCRSFLRLGMFRERGYKMVLEPDGVDPSSLNGSASPLGHNTFQGIQANRFSGRRSGRMLRSVRPTQSVRSDLMCVRMLTAEALHIARPVVYCKFQHFMLLLVIV